MILNLFAIRDPIAEAKKGKLTCQYLSCRNHDALAASDYDGEAVFSQYLFLGEPKEKCI